MSRCEDNVTTFPSFSVPWKIVQQTDPEALLPKTVRPVMARKARLGRKSCGAKQEVVGCHGGLRSPGRLNLIAVSLCTLKNKLSIEQQNRTYTMVRAALLFDLVRLVASQDLGSCSDLPFHNFSTT